MPSEYEKRMAAKSKAVAAELASRRKELAEAINEVDSLITENMETCPHLNSKDHPRQTAEDHPWRECLDCGFSEDC